jgi:hypothetical protein
MASTASCRWTDLGTTKSGLGPQSQYVSCAGSKTPNGFEACCVAGDVCLEDGICHYTHPEANGSGFYLAGCTDPAYQDSSCPQQCGKTNDSEYSCSGEAQSILDTNIKFCTTDQLPGPDIVYNATSSLWACCNWDDSAPPNRVCSDPSDDTFQASSPENLLNVVSSQTSAPSTVSTTMSQITPQTSSKQTSSSSANNHTSTSLSTGAKAGIGVGVTLDALLLLLLLFWAVVITRKFRRMRGQSGNVDQAGVQRMFSEPEVGISGQGAPSELHGDQSLR